MGCGSSKKGPGLSHTTLGNIPQLRQVTVDQAKSIMKVMTTRMVEAGETLFNKGDQADYFYVIDKGTVIIEVDQQDKWSDFHHKTELGPGKAFGELGIIHGTPRTATAKAKTELKLMCLDAHTFDQLIGSRLKARREKYLPDLDQIPILSAMSAYERCLVADMIEEVEIGEGEKIIKEGEKSDAFYMLKGGECVVTLVRVNPEGKKYQVERTRLYNSYYFGEVGLLENCPRTCTVTAVEPTQLLKLDEAAFHSCAESIHDQLRQKVKLYDTFEDKLVSEPDFSEEEEEEEDDDEDVGDLPPQDLNRSQGPRVRRTSVTNESKNVSSKEDAEKMLKDIQSKKVDKSDADQSAILETISKSVLFGALDDFQKKVVVDAMFPCKHKPGDVIIQQGDDGDNFYVVHGGECDIFVGDKKVLTVGPGGSFGELALLYNQPRAATVKASGEVELWAMDRETFTGIMMSSTLQKRMMYDTFLENVTILAGLDKYERSTLADALQTETFAAGTDIISQGEEGDKFYIVEEGEACVTQKRGEDEPELKMKTYGRGDYFGELALMTHMPRAATVKAETDVRCVYLDKAAFDRLLGGAEEVLMRNMGDYEEYEEVLLREKQNK